MIGVLASANSNDIILDIKANRLSWEALLKVKTDEAVRLVSMGILRSKRRSRRISTSLLLDLATSVQGIAASFLNKCDLLRSMARYELPPTLARLPCRSRSAPLKQVVAEKSGRTDLDAIMC